MIGKNFRSKGSARETQGENAKNTKGMTQRTQRRGAGMDATRKTGLAIVARLGHNQIIIEIQEFHMPAIVPIRDLKDTAKISALCKETDAPVFITKNGYGELVLMSIATYERTLARQEVFDRIDEAERQFSAGQTRDAFASLAELRAKHHV